jgi:isocitrate/isopropylmalate dehydrogenase
MMLEWLGGKRGDAVAIREAQRVEHAIRRMLTGNRRTIDIGGDMSTIGFTNAVIDLMY